MKSEPQHTPQLSKKELEKRHSEGLCYHCGGPDHISQNCPEGKSVTHMGNKPPRKTLFSVKLGAIGEVSESSPEVLDSLPLGAIEFAEGTSDCHCSHDLVECQHKLRVDKPDGHNFIWHQKPRFCEPDWINQGPAPRKFIGDCYGMMATHVLYECQPYLGDELNDPYDVNHFTLIPYAKHYQILDSHAGFHVNVPCTLLENPQFDLGSWYSKRRVKALSLCYPGPVYHYLFGDPISYIGSKLLEDEIESSYPCIDPLPDPEGRFNLYPLHDNLLEYIVDDAELSLQLPVPKDSLLNPTFDLVSWYCDQLENCGLYNSMYLTKSLEIFEDKLAHLDINKPIPGVNLDAQDKPDILISAINLAEDLFEEGLKGSEAESVLGDPPELQAVSDSDSEFSEVDYPTDSQQDDPLDLQSVSDSESEFSEVGDAPDQSQEDLDLSGSSPEEWQSHFERDLSLEPVEVQGRFGDMSDVYSVQIKSILTHCQPFPGDMKDGWATQEPVDGPCFVVT